MKNFKGCWMCSKDDVNSVRNWMGNFSDIKCIGKYAARLGQSLSSSVETFQTNRFDFYIIISPNSFYYTKCVLLKSFSFVLIPDIMTHDGKYCFTDGVGKISMSKALEICKTYFDSNKYASTFQIRFAGFKGVLTAWPDLTRDQIQFRPSMNKFSR